MAAKKETEEIAVVEDATLAFSLDDFADLKSSAGLGMEIVDTSDIVMPKIKMCQSNSREVMDGLAKPGQFYNSMTKEAKDTLDDVVIMCFGKSRIRFKQPFSRNDAPLCRSLDGILSTEGEVCENCQYCQWQDKDGNQIDPECRMSYTLLGFEYKEDGDFGTPFRMLVTGSSIPEFKRTCLTPLKVAGYPPFIFRCQVTSKKTEKDGNIFFVEEIVLKKTEDGKFITINPKYKDMLKDLTERWNSMMNKVNDFETTHAVEEVAENPEGAIF